MSQAQQPNFPQLGDVPGGPRLSSSLRELVGLLLHSGQFVQRLSVGAIIVPSDSGGPVALRWGYLNRVFLTADFSVFLPPIDPRFVGVPLEFVLLETGNVATLQPSGLGLSSPVSPLINGATSLNKNVAGLYRFATDGQNWFTDP